MAISGRRIVELDNVVLEKRMEFALESVLHCGLRTGSVCSLVRHYSGNAENASKPRKEFRRLALPSGAVGQFRDRSRPSHR